MIRGSGRFRRSDRLLRSRDFQRVGRDGKRVASGDFVVLVVQSPLISPNRADKTRPNADVVRGRRLGVTVSRKVGNAVVRNRVKRSVREWFRTRRSELPDGVDVVVIARRGAAGLAGGEINRRLCGLVGMREIRGECE